MRSALAATFLLTTVMLTGNATHATETLVYASNYDVRLTVADSVAHITSRSRVRNGSKIPIDFQQHRVDLSIASGKNSTVVVTVQIFERAQAALQPMLPEPLVFEAKLTTPTEFGWQNGDVSVSIAIVVSEHGR